MGRKLPHAGSADHRAVAVTRDSLLDWMWHGGALGKAQTAFPAAAGPWIDLSTGINPNPWPHGAEIKIDWHRLPELDELQRLEQAAADHYGVAPDQICAVSGSEMAMRMTGLLLGGVGRCESHGYRTHREMFATCHLLHDINQAAPDLPLILANPANPSGRILSSDELDRLLDRRPNMWTLIDEAYADAHPEIGVVSMHSTHAKLIVFKSLGKFFGLAGLRLGFVIGPPHWIAVLRHHIGAWPVSAAAISIGTAALRDRAWIAETRVNLTKRAHELDQIIASNGLISSGSCHLFRRVKTSDAHALFQHFCQHGILTRPFADDPHYLRLGLPADEAQMARLETALRDV
jgi:cobalamin biosynthetic protein CobC